MKKTLLICFAFLVIGTTATKAQDILDKIDRAVNKADRASNTADRAGKTGSKIGSLFGKKKTDAETKTTIRISGATFTSLKSINDKIQLSKGVAETKMKFNASSSTIVVMHAGSTEDLLKALQKTAPVEFAEKNLTGMDDGEISVKTKD